MKIILNSLVFVVIYVAAGSITTLAYSQDKESSLSNSFNGRALNLSLPSTPSKIKVKFSYGIQPENFDKEIPIIKNAGTLDGILNIAITNLTNGG
jgi:hypothetical protein